MSSLKRLPREQKQNEKPILQTFLTTLDKTASFCYSDISPLILQSSYYIAVIQFPP